MAMLDDIVKIQIVHTPHIFARTDEYKDTISLTDNSLTYDLKPGAENDSQIPVKWSYRTSSKKFKTYYYDIAVCVNELLSLKSAYCIDDASSVEFRVRFADGFGCYRLFWAPEDKFDSVFQLIRCLIPPMDEYPEMMKYLLKEDTASSVHHY